MRVYIPFWFKVKTQPLLKDGARHFNNFIKFTRYLPPNYRTIVDKVISRNAYFAHHENILLSMVADDNIEVRELAINKIMSINKYPGKRVFKVPSVNFSAE